MELQIAHRDHGILLSDIERVDAFNFDETKTSIEQAVKNQALSVAMDLRKTQFLSLSTIKLIYQISLDLDRRGGRLALIAPTEKLKRQIDIYASLDYMSIFKTIDQWERASCAGEA